MTNARRRPGPAPRISRSAVLEAARRLPGDSLTMAAIGAELGVTPPALYRYFPDRAAVLEALAQDARDRLAPPDPSLPWRAWLLEAARRERDLWASHPELPEAAGWRASYRAISRPALHMLEAAVDVLVDAGFEPVDAICGLAAVSQLAHSIGWSQGQTDQLLEPDVHADIVSLKASARVTITPDVLFERTLSLVLDGLALKLKPSTPAASTGRSRPPRKPHRKDVAT